MNIQEKNKLVSVFMNSNIFDYEVSHYIDINDVRIKEGDLIKADGYGTVLEDNRFYCVELYEGEFGSCIYSDFEPLSRYRKIEVVGHCSDYIEIYKNGDWSGNLGAAIKSDITTRYQDDLNLLMEVVKKIQSFNISFIMGNDGNPRTKPSASFNHNALTTISGSIDIWERGETIKESIFNVVVVFIEWYNKNHNN